MKNNISNSEYKEMFDEYTYIENWFAIKNWRNLSLMYGSLEQAEERLLELEEILNTHYQED